MRILRLDLDTGEELDLHPFVSVLGGLDPAAGRAVLHRLVAIATGETQAGTGLVEAHGLMVEIAPGRLAGFDLPAEAEIVVSAEQLPGATLGPVTSASDERRRALRDELTLVDGELARVTEEMHHLVGQLDQRTSELDEARRALDEFAITAHETALRAVTEAEELFRQRLAATTPEPSAPTPEAIRRQELAAELEERRRDHHQLEAELDHERLGLLQLLEQLEAERARLDEYRAELAAGDDAGPGEGADEASPPADSEPDPDGAEQSLPEPAVIAQVVETIRAVLSGPAAQPLVPSLPAVALADQVAAHRQRFAEFEREMAERGLDPDAVEARLADARKIEAEAAEAAKPRAVPPEDEAEIERLHDEVLEHANRRRGRFQKESARVYENVSTKLEVILERYGYPTYAAYVMGRTVPSIDEAARQRHMEATRLIAQLEQELEEVLAAVESDPHARMLRAEHDQLWSAAEQLLGERPDDLERALREFRVAAPVDWDAPDQLREMLRGLGVDVGPAGTAGSLVELADRWVTEAEAAHARAAGDSPVDPVPETPSEPLEADQPDALVAQVETQVQLVDELFDQSIRLDAELADREAAFERSAGELAERETELATLEDSIDSAADTAGDADPAMAARLAADPVVRTAREQVTLTEARLHRHHQAAERVDDLHLMIGGLRRQERTLVASSESLQERRQRLNGELAALDDAGAPLPTVEWHLDADGIGPIEWYLLGRAASLRSVSPAGSVPLVLDHAFRGLPTDAIEALCDVLSGIGETVQVIYLGDELTVASWAERQGLDRAAVVRPGQPVL